MSYATPEQLAKALEIQVTPDNQQLLQDCLDAAATEVDQILADCVYVDADGPPTIVSRVNVNRAVEWFKAPAAYNGGVGYNDIGSMQAPASGFERHALALQPLRQAWGIA